MGSSGYGSYGSNGSHEQQVSIGSSSESNGNIPAGNAAEETSKTKPSRTFQEICKGVHMLKNQDSQVCLRSSSPWPPKNDHRKTTDGESACNNRLQQNSDCRNGSKRCFFLFSLFSSSEEFSCASEGLRPASQRRHRRQHGGLPLQRPDRLLLPADQLPRQRHPVRFSCPFYHK